MYEFNKFPRYSIRNQDGDSDTALGWMTKRSYFENRFLLYKYRAPNNKWTPSCPRSRSYIYIPYTNKKNTKTNLKKVTWLSIKLTKVILPKYIYKKKTNEKKSNATKIWPQGKLKKEYHCSELISNDTNISIDILIW